MEINALKDMMPEELEQVNGGTLPDSPEFKACVEYRNYLMKKYNCWGSMLRKIALPEEWAKFLELFEAYRATTL